MEQEIEEDASREEQLYSKVQAVQENEAEDDAFREERSFDRAHAPGPSLSADSGSEVPSEAAAQQQEEVRHVVQHLHTLLDAAAIKDLFGCGSACPLAPDEEIPHSISPQDVIICHGCRGDDILPARDECWTMPAGKQGDRRCR